MQTKQAIIQHVLAGKNYFTKKNGHAYAPANIALCKYWGKRDAELNLPITSSLSVSLQQKGAKTEIEKINGTQHELIINNTLIQPNSPHAQRFCAFLDYFQSTQPAAYRLTLNFTIPIAAGLASSACAFASIVKALDDLHQWQLDNTQLSILARLGSGSACRSIETGFVEWERGERSDGLDSVAKPLHTEWPSLCIGLCLINTEKKVISSSEGMQRTMDTSDFYSLWHKKANRDLSFLKKAIQEKDFDTFGRTAESNAIAMHALMQTAWPPIIYSTPDTLRCIQLSWALRQEGLPLYFTQDAGPNLKLLFLDTHLKAVQDAFAGIALEIIYPFNTKGDNHERHDHSR